MVIESKLLSVNLIHLDPQLLNEVESINKLRKKKELTVLFVKYFNTKVPQMELNAHHHLVPDTTIRTRLKLVKMTKLPITLYATLIKRYIIHTKLSRRTNLLGSI